MGMTKGKVMISESYDRTTPKQRTLIQRLIQNYTFLRTVNIITVRYYLLDFVLFVFVYCYSFVRSK